MFYFLQKRLILWLFQTNLYRFIVKYVLPRISVGSKHLSHSQVKQIRCQLRAGDILLSRGNHLSSFLVKGKYSHAAIVVDSRGVVAEMTAADFNLISIYDFMLDAKFVSLFRLDPYDGVYGCAMADKALSLQNALYDVQFQLGIQALYCSELCFVADFEQRMGVSLEDLVGLGRPYISPDGLSKALHLKHIVSYIV